MARSFTSNFTTRMLEANQKPYLVLKIAFTTGDKYYLDREAETFLASGVRHPVAIEDSLVVDWGNPGQSLREMQVGSVDSITVRVEDRAGELSAILNAEPQQRRAVELYRMFDEDDVVWPTDAALIYVGTTKPFSYTESDNVVSFEVEDPSRQLAGTVERRCTDVIFPLIPPESKDKSAPLAWGYAQRVPALLVSKPYQVRILEPINLAAGLGSRVALEGHPDELGITVDTELEVLVGPDDGTDGAMGLTGKFRQSVNKAEQPSYFEMTGYAGCESVPFSVAGVLNGGTEYAAAILFNSADPDDNARITPGARCTIDTGDDRYFVKIIGCYKNATQMQVTFDRLEANAALGAGSVVRVWYRYVEVLIDSEGDASMPRKEGDLDDLNAGLDDTQRTFFIEQPAGIVGNLAEMFPPPFSAVPLGEVVGFPVTAFEANTPINGTYRMTVDYSTGTAVLDGTGAGDTLVLGEQANLPLECPAGSVIRPVTGEWVYLVSSFPSKEIICVEGYGDVADESNTGRKDFIVLPEYYRVLLTGDDGEAGDAVARVRAWTANLVDDTWNLTGGLDGTAADFGTDVTTITFSRTPRRINAALDSDDIWVTVRGTDYNFNGSSTVIYNPADVLKAYLTHPFLMGLDSANVDEASFDAAAASRALVDVRVGFAQVEKMDGLTLLQDIARQCRSAIVFDQGKFSMRVLYNACPSWDATFDQTCIMENTLRIVESALDDMVTRVTANWRSRWDDKQKPRQRTVVNDVAEEDYPINSKSLEYWIYHEPEYVDIDIAFWLERWCRIYRNITLEGSMRGLVLQPPDWIDLTYVDGTAREIVPDNSKCEVLDVKDKAPGGLVQITCRYAQFTF
jgi:hypothetical protein